AMDWGTLPKVFGKEGGTSNSKMEKVITKN
ncbi:MAG: hypothetical protein RL403_1249, partial [Bacteroidota bacterium]